MKCSCLPITAAFILIAVYASTGFYTLIEITGISNQLTNNTNETTLWSRISSPISIDLNWISLAVYFSIALLIIILLCGIQCKKPCLVFLWIITMIVMLLVDGITTILTLQQNKHKHHLEPKKMEILLCIMLGRLLILLCCIFTTVFYYRQVTKARSACLKREQMLVDDNPKPPVSQNSWTNSAALLHPLNDSTTDHFIPDIPTPMSFSRTQISTIQNHSTSPTFQPRESFPPPSEIFDDNDPLSSTEYNEDNRYNIPLEEIQHNTPLEEIHHEEATNLDDHEYQNNK